ncbi:hypothetical protein NKH45_34330 [Mesorhizobium sp. M1156]|uniref:hypothetical protein n=1 Tax=Mesorhizobium sp. M1156 TaxID=2957064 RepID=UPI00333DF02E
MTLNLPDLSWSLRRNLYVAPDCENATPVDKDEILASGLLGEFRRNHGWDEWAHDPRYTNEHWRMESVFLRARDMAIAEAAGNA